MQIRKKLGISVGTFNLWRQQISDYDILLIEGGWLVEKSNRPLPFVNQKNRRGGGTESVKFTE